MEAGVEDCTVAILALAALLPARVAERAMERWLGCRSVSRPHQKVVTTIKEELNAPENREDGDIAPLLERFRASGTTDADLSVDAAMCRRFLRAWKGDLAGAVSGIENYLEWRKTVRPANITPEDVRVELASRKGYPHGLDRCGRPVLWAFAARHDKHTRDAEETVKLILYCLEKTIRNGEENGAEQVCLVFDLSGFSSKSMDYEVTKRLFLLLANYYPERLGQVLLLNAPSVFGAFWRIIRPYIDPVTFEKIQFVSKEALREFIDVDMLPREVA